MKNETYDFLKKVALVYIPGIATCIGTIFNIWNIPYGDAIVATITAIDTCLGIFLGISSKKYAESIGGNNE